MATAAARLDAYEHHIEATPGVRAHRPPVITRIRKDELVLDLRTIQDDEFSLLAQALAHAVGVEG